MRVDRSISPGVTWAEFFVESLAPKVFCDLFGLVETEGVVGTEACWADDMRFVAWAIRVGTLISFAGLAAFPESAGGVVADEAGSLLERAVCLELCGWAEA